MQRHEIEARLKQVREQIALLDAGAEGLAADLKKDVDEQKERNARWEAREKARKEAEERQRASLWGRVKLGMGFRDKPLFRDEEGSDLGDGIGLLFGAVKLATLAPFGAEAYKKYNELKREEGRLLDQLEQLEPHRQKELTKGEERDKIYQEMAIRKQEWERIRQHETDETRLRRLKNMYDDADARDEERLRQLL